MNHQYLKNVVSLKYDSSKCNGCGMCMTVCPHNVFEMQNGISNIRNKDKCIECGACMENCQTKALTVKAGVGCAAGIIYGILNNTEPTCNCGDSSSACC
jgi:NAD-dependent dihydropyrimidine dehydrogenase PreA subunit